MELGEWNQMFALNFASIASNSRYNYVSFYDVDDINSKYKFRKDLKFMLKASNDSEEYIWFYFQGEFDKTLYCICLDVDEYQKKMYLSSKLIKQDETKKAGCAELMASNSERKEKYSLKKEIEEYLKKAPDQRLRILTGWKIEDRG